MVGVTEEALWADGRGEYAWPTPLADITISLAKEEAENYDLAAVKEIAIVMDCEVIPIPNSA
jgi:hypothetical protein